MAQRSVCPSCGQVVGGPSTVHAKTGEFSASGLVELSGSTGEPAGSSGAAIPAAAGPPPWAAGPTACSWCGKPAREVRKLLTGPGVGICDECVSLCHTILSHELPGYRRP